MKHLPTKLTALAIALLVFATPFTSFAAVDRVVVDSLSPGFGNARMSFCPQWLDGTTQVDNNCLDFSIATTTTNQQMLDAANASINSYSASQGYPTNVPILWPYPTTAQVQTIASTTAQAYASQALSFATSSRSLNSAFQVSASRASFVSYTVDVATTLSLTGGQTGTVTLQYADDSGFTTNVKTIQSSVNGNTGTLTLGLAITQTGTAALTGLIPAGKYVRLSTANTVGTPTFTYRAGQEVLLGSN